jgi:hypothetical protein
MRQHVAFISSHCPNCTRFVDAIRLSERAQKEVNIVDIDTLSASARSQLRVVPTVTTVDGKTVTGSEAFTFLKEYESDSQLGAYEIGSSALVFSDYTRNDGIAETVGFFDSFEPLP